MLNNQRLNNQRLDDDGEPDDDQEPEAAEQHPLERQREQIDAPRRELGLESIGFDVTAERRNELEAGREASRGTVWQREPYRVSEGGLSSDWDPFAQ